MQKIVLTTLLAVSVSGVFASPDTLALPNPATFVFHKNINDAQQKIDLLDKKKDTLVSLTKNPEINLQVSDAIFRRVDKLQADIENHPVLKKNNDKIRYLVYLRILLSNYIGYTGSSLRNRQFDPVYTPELIKQFEKAVMLQIDSMSILPVINSSSYPVNKMIVEVLKDDVNYGEVKKTVYLQFCTLFPSRVLETLTPYANESFADSLVTLSAYRNPSQLYNYAASTSSAVGRLIHNSTNPLVKTVASISQLPNALLYFPFMDDIVNNRKTVDGISKYVGDGEATYDSVGYFKLLVQTEIAYAKRLHAKDTPIAMLGANGLRDMLRRKDSMHFIKWINEMHNDPEAKRMKPVEPLSSVDLYYAIVMGEDDIYTSSYRHSFNRLIQRLGPKARTDSLLELVDYDYFKKFIKMAANFNRLDTFLKLMPPEKAETLMKNFVSGLEKAGGLEDAVDVADSYSSITSKTLQTNILAYIKENEIKAEGMEDMRGKTIYSLLKTIFLSTDSTVKPRIDLTKEFGIPSIYDLPVSFLKNDSGIIAEQMFFYGDDDGKGNFRSYTSRFSPAIWKKTDKPEWVEFTPIKNPNKFIIYANKALDSQKNLDDSAQAHLNDYLRSIKVEPTIVVHRGHSYWLPGTIKRMPYDAKLIVLGSCGGYKNLGPIIQISPSAHIISSKQTGKGIINNALLDYIHKKVVEGKTLNWPAMWAELDKQLLKHPDKDTRETWPEYIPPHKNLGAIFLKAYNKKMQE